MGRPVVTVAAGGLPVVEVTNGRGTPVTEAANKYGLAVTKVVGKPGLPVIFVAATLQRGVDAGLQSRAEPVVDAKPRRALASPF